MRCLNDLNDIYKKFKYQLYDFILNNYVVDYDIKLYIT